MDVKETDILGDTINEHWYYKSKAKAMMKYILPTNSPRKILDVGAGSGFFSHYLLEHTNTEEAYCVDISYPKNFDEKVFNKNIHYRQSIDVINCDLVLLMDVLEHVDNDIELLKIYIDKVPVGAKFFISVPAFNFLWSGHDVFLEHKRRYTLHQLQNVVRDAGLHIEDSSYYFGLVFPIALATRFLNNIINAEQHTQSQLKQHSFIINTILKFICFIELPFIKMNKFAGLSIFCLATKN